MKVYFNQLPASLEQKFGSFYLISGEEPLQLMEAGDLIRSKAKAHGFEQRELFFVDSGFDWSTLESSARSLSLFSERRILDIRLLGGKLTKRGTTFFKAMLADPPPDLLIIVQAIKVDARTAWVKSVSEQGVWVQVYQKNYSEIKNWVTERLLRSRLNAAEGVVEIIAERSEGNMLAAAQEIEKLTLISEDQHISLEQAEHAIGDSAHYSVYELADATVSGETKRAVRIFNSLRSEATAEQLVLWALTASIRQLIKMEYRLASGESEATVMKMVWKSKQAVFRKALARGLRGRWWALLYICQDVDKAIKGQGLEDCWNSLQSLVLKISGVKPLMAKVADTI